VLLYADVVTDSMKRMIDETRRRRKIQADYNREHGITPETIRKEIREGIEAIKKAREIVEETAGVDLETGTGREVLSELEAEMEEAARRLDFERAIRLRDEVRRLQKKLGLDAGAKKPARPSSRSPRTVRKG
jgi:excinuclease ABC subunit B